MREEKRTEGGDGRAPGDATRMTSQQEFWNWFSQHEGELFNFEADRERIFDQLAAELQKVDPNLTFEFGPSQPRREFVISAGGVRLAFQAVSALVSAAPPLNDGGLRLFVRDVRTLTL